MKPAWTPPIVTAVVALLVGCGYRTPLDPGELRAAGGGAGHAAIAGSPSSAGGASGDFGSSAVAGAGAADAGGGVCRGTCATAPGPVVLAATEEDLAKALVGTWEICSGGHALFGGAPSDTIGVEFGPSTATDYGTWVGTAYFLKRGGTGPVRGQGPAYEQTYQVADDMTVSCRAADGVTGSWFEVLYSLCPEEWWLKSYSGGRGTLASF